MAVKTVLDIIDILYQGLKGSSLDLSISGDLYKLKRPIASSLEDVVINSLPINNEQLQSGVANVNIYVPNVTVMVSNNAEQYANFVRLKSLGGLAWGALNEVWSADYDYDVQQSTVIEDTETDAHYINIRVDFNSENF